MAVGEFQPIWIIFRGHFTSLADTLEEGAIKGTNKRQ